MINFFWPYVMDFGVPTSGKSAVNINKGDTILEIWEKSGGNFWWKIHEKLSKKFWHFISMFY